MKGLELPINMIVVIAIAVLVLVVVAAFFAGRLGSGTNDINLEAAFSQGCQILRSANNCDSSQLLHITSYTPPGAQPGSGTNFFPAGSTGTICTLKGYSTDRACATACGCQI